MRKVLFLFALLPMLFSCSSEENELNYEKLKSQIVGVWEYNDILVSFDEYGYYAAILDETFLDCGSFILNKDEITCKNNYLNKNTKYIIESIDNNGINMIVTYNNYKNEEVNKNITLYKTDKKPASKDNILIGKIYNFLLSGYGGCNIIFNSHNIAEMKTESVKPITQIWNYFYIEPYVYSQKYKHPSDALSIYFKNCDKGIIFKQEVEIGDSGEIKRIEIKN